MRLLISMVTVFLLFIPFNLVLLAAATKEECLECHSDQELTTIRDGKEISLYVNEKLIEETVHGDLDCVDCHTDIAEIPHPEQLKPVECNECHPAVFDVYKTSIHGKDSIKGIKDVATCQDCHGGHNIYPKWDPRSMVYHLNLPSTCAQCHADPKLIEKYNIPIGNAYQLYMDSIHGRAISKSGLLVAANCSDCHGSHDIKPHSDPSALIYRKNIPSTCGKCHAGIVAVFKNSVHGEGIQNGNSHAPTCIDCHTAHHIQRVEAETWKLDIITECGTCHEKLLETYRDTYHGQVTMLGFTRVARCSDCHGSHDILPPTNPRSTLAKDNIVATCQKCHPRANRNFTQYDSHADVHDKEGNILLYYSYKFMHYLLLGVFTFFAPHTGLWLYRSLKESLKHKKA
jgi:nitrate/TMAO reductase-like tetraheme cytochrome c subunit